MSKLKKSHHHVWKHHLRAWAVDEQIWCRYNDGDSFPSNVTGVGVQNHFYKLKELSEKDIDFVRKYVIGNSPAEVRERHEYWINLFTAVHRRKRFAEERGIASKELEDLIKELEQNFEENLHGAIEKSGISILEMMREGDLEFYNDEDQCSTFFHYLTTQYYRTNPMKQRMSAAYEKLGLSDFDATWNISAHINATDLGAYLYVNRKKYLPVILDVDCGFNLITGDQPVINSHHSAGGMASASPTNLELYYPLGPSRALLLRDLSVGATPMKKKLKDKDVKYFNSRVAMNSFAQLYGKRKYDLDGYSAFGSAVV